MYQLPAHQGIDWFLNHKQRLHLLSFYVFLLSPCPFMLCICIHEDRSLTSLIIWCVACRPAVYSDVSLPDSLPGHDRYYNKYINVKKGGIGGVAMLLVGYVAISYLWEYDHISKKCLHPLTAFYYKVVFIRVNCPILCLISSVSQSRYNTSLMCKTDFKFKHPFLHLLFQNTTAGGSTTEPLQQTFRGWTWISLFPLRFLLSALCCVEYVTVVTNKKITKIYCWTSCFGSVRVQFKFSTISSVATLCGYTL